MNVSNTALKFLVGILAGLMVGGIIYVSIAKSSYEKQIVDLNNTIATKDKTIEVDKDVYTKQTIQIQDISSTLTSKDAQIVALNAQLKKANEDLLSATNLAITWKQNYEAMVAAKQSNVPSTPIPGQPTVERIKVDFTKDFGYIGINGYCLTSPPEAYVDIHQNRPLKLTLALSQDSSKNWHTYVTSSESNMDVDIGVTAVNPYMFDIKWYQRLSVSGAIAAGGNGALAGLGIGVDISKFTVGINVYEYTGGLSSPFYGLSLSWRPFAN